MHRKLLIAIAFLFIAGGIAGCSPGGGPSTRSNPYADEINDNARFRGFYEEHGGFDVFGPLLTAVATRDGVDYQYTTTVLMFYNPNLPQGQRYGLVPLGRELGIAEAPTDMDAPGGHPIHDTFRDIYNTMGKARYTGLPLTGGRYNPERGGLEQYFENVGFYHLDSDPPSVVHLIEYGAWYCAEYCNYDSAYEAAPMRGPIADAPFSEAVQRFLDPKFMGTPLTEPYIARDGQQEQVFENIVIIAAANRPGGIALRAIPALLGIQTLHDANLEVPRYFEEYILENGGWEFTGWAITAYDRRSDELYRQCFTNLCLDYYPNHAGDQQVRVTPLGYAYKDRYYQSQDEQPQPALPSTQNISLTAWEGYPVIAPDEQQVIGVAVHADGQPLGDYEPVLTLTVPLSDGSVRTYAYSFAPTRADSGKSSLTINPIDAPHGTRVLYEVCPWRDAPTELCVLDDFLIWW